MDALLLPSTAVDMSESGDLTGLPRLTHNGYSRRPETEADIRALLGMRARALIDAFRESQSSSPAYRRTEALIFFIRRALADGDDRVISGLFTLLRARCKPFLLNAIRGFDDDTREEIQASIYENMTSLLLRDDDSSDFLQRSFWLYLKRRTITAIARAGRDRDRTLLFDDYTVDDDEGAPSRIDAGRDRDLSPEDMALLQDGLAALPPDLRQLYILRHMEGWRVGDERRAEGDPEDPTLAERYERTPRAIRKRLAKAEELLNRYRKDIE